MTENSVVRLNPKSSRLPFVIGGLLVGAFMLLGVFQVYRTSTPEYALKKVDQAYDKADLHLARDYISATGMKVLEYALQNKDESPQGKESIIFKKRIGNEFHVRSTKPGNNGPSTGDTIFVRNGMKWKFDDVYLLTVDGYKIELKGSYIIDAPLKAGAIIAWNNPGLILSGFLRGVLIGLSL